MNSQQMKTTEKVWNVDYSRVWSCILSVHPYLMHSGTCYTQDGPVKKVLTDPVIVVQMLSTVLNIIIFEDCRNQWSMSRPLLGLILLNEKVNVTHRSEPSWKCLCVFVLTHKFVCPAVFCWPEEQHRQQPATREAAGHALMFRELDGGNREEPTNKEPGQVGLID